MSAAKMPFISTRRDESALLDIIVTCPFQIQGLTLQSAHQWDKSLIYYVQ